MSTEPASAPIVGTPHRVPLSNRDAARADAAPSKQALLRIIGLIDDVARSHMDTIDLHRQAEEQIDLLLSSPPRQEG